MPLATVMSHYALSNGVCEAITEHKRESVMMRELARLVSQNIAPLIVS